MTNNTIVKNDNHEQDIQIILDRISNITVNGVIHIGGHKGEEVKNYLESGIENIILIEANPELYIDLTRNFTNTNVSSFNYAICDKDQIVDFYIHKSNSGLESSSILKMDKFDKIVTSLYTSEAIQVQGLTLDSFCVREKINLEKYNFLVCDIQGADYFAIKGAKNVISNFDVVLVEIQCIPLYENFISEKQFDDLMNGLGFFKDFVVYHELYKDDDVFPAWGEALYLRK